MDQPQDKTPNDQNAANGAVGNNVPTVDTRITELTKRLEEAERSRQQVTDELERRDVKQALSDARDAFVKSVPNGVPAAYADILFEYAKGKGELMVTKSGWHWKDAKDPVAGASAFWKTIPTIESQQPAAPNNQPPVGIPLPTGPRLTLSSLFGGT